jgi:hypothetical protein
MRSDPRESGDIPEDVLKALRKALNPEPPTWESERGKHTRAMILHIIDEVTKSSEEYKEEPFYPSVAALLSKLDEVVNALPDPISALSIVGELSALLFEHLASCKLTGCPHDRDHEYIQKTIDIILGAHDAVKGD